MENKTFSVVNEVEKTIVGKNEIIKKVFMAILSGGHILLDDVPGVGKTTMALSFHKALGLDYKRIQFTPDSMPSDITGFSIYDKESGKFKYMKGSAVTNLLLADEINRASAKTQSALLEVMEEGKITVDGVTRNIEKPFIVIATQNPAGSDGTQKLPNSQLDRFMVRLHMGYPDTENLVNLLKDRHHSNPLDNVKCVVNKEELLKMQEEVAAIYVSDEIYMYVAKLVENVGKHEMVRLGISPRGALAMCRMAKAHAHLNGRDYVVPGDVEATFSDVCAHRIILEAKSRISDISPEDILKEVLEKTVIAVK